MLRMPTEHDSQLDELIALCLEAERLGVPLDRQALVQRHPAHAAELAEFLEGHDGLKRLALPEAHHAARSERQADAASTVAETLPYLRQVDDDGCLQLGKYRLMRELGRGGMGVVYEAWQDGVNRPVALKVLSSGPYASDEEIRRFRIEAEAAASLSHPSLVPIYEVDVCDGRPFYSMELIDGKNIVDHAEEEIWTCEKIAQTVAAVADAVEYAHRRGVLHRDLKPANVLIDATGRPRVTDFGLAKRLENENALPTRDAPAGDAPGPNFITRTGAILGTPSFMAPEQAAGERVGPAADIYGIGAILYYLLTKRPPFRGATTVETLSLVTEGRLEPVRNYNTAVERDLAVITEKCLEKEPSDRYRTAAEVADDLRRYAAGEPIRAGGLSLWGRLTRAVGQSRHVSHFRQWGRSIMGFGVVIFVAHLIMHLVTRAGISTWWAFLPPRLAMFAVLVGILRWSRTGSLLPRDAVERLVWVVWTAYLLAFAAAGLVTAATGREHSSVYPFASVLAGMAFFTLGCHVWGACYLVGGAFFLAAPLLALAPEYAVLGFGSLWGISLLMLGLRYDRLNRLLPVEDAGLPKR